MSNLVKYQGLGAAANTVASVADLAQQMIVLNTFYAASVSMANGGNAINPQQLAAAQTAASALQADLVAMGATAPAAQATGATGSAGYSMGVVAAVGVGSFIGGILADELVRGSRR